ncbi:hypothetical protein CBE37_02960 [bacterium TMED277]|nr:MAG: hypothetical protein CBE37_02960 [bacterium TMED277]
MQKKTKELNENLIQNHEALEGILGDIKDVVSEETETRFKVQIEQKVIKLKKSDLVDCNSVNKDGSVGLSIDKSELESLIRKIVRQEIIKKDEILLGKSKGNRGLAYSKKKDSYQFSKMTKVQLEEIGRKGGIELDRRKTKAALIKELQAKGVK